MFRVETLSAKMGAKGRECISCCERGTSERHELRELPAVL